MNPNSFQPLIYIVDDEILAANSLAAILRRSGMRAIPFTDPRQALSQARLIPPQLLVANLAMPAMSGVDLAAGMSQVAPNCRFLFFSDSLQAQTLPDWARLQDYCFEFERKTINTRDLLARCNRLTIQGIAPFVSSVLPGVPLN